MVQIYNLNIYKTNNSYKVYRNISIIFFIYYLVLYNYDIKKM
jgi:hypothetical protein